MSKRVLLAFVLGVLLPLTAAAQRIELTPLIGAYGPISNIETLRYSNSCPETQCHTRAQVIRNWSYAWGAQAASYWPSGLGVEATFTNVSGSRLISAITSDLPDGPGPTARVDQRFVLAFLGLRAVARFAPGPQVVASVGAGPALAFIGPTRPAPSGLNQPYVGAQRTLGLNVHAGVGIPFAARGRLELRMLHLVYRATYLREDDDAPQVRTQHDLVSSIGVTWAVRQ